MSSVRVRLFDDLSIRKCSGSRHAPECFGIFNPSRLVCSTKMGGNSKHPKLQDT